MRAIIKTIFSVLLLIILLAGFQNCVKNDLVENPFNGGSLGGEPYPGGALTGIPPESMYRSFKTIDLLCQDGSAAFIINKVDTKYIMVKNNCVETFNEIPKTSIHWIDSVEISFSFEGHIYK